MEISFFQFHIVSASIGCLHLCIACKRKICFVIERITDICYCVTSYCMLRTIVQEASALFCDSYDYFIFRSSYNQLTFMLTDLIVICIGSGV